MRRISATARRLGALAIPLCAATLLGQYALDENLQVGGGRVNPSSGYSAPMGRDPYRINRRTGTFQYNQPGAFGWGPRSYTVGAQEYLMRTGMMDTYARPVETMGQNSSVYNKNWRTGTYRYNNTNAFSQQGYRVYQSAGSPAAAQKPIDIGDSTPVYRSARGSSGSAGRASNYDPMTPLPSSQGYEQVRTSVGTGARGSSSPSMGIANLTPQVYRPPYVRLASDAE